MRICSAESLLKTCIVKGETFNDSRIKFLIQRSGHDDRSSEVAFTGTFLRIPGNIEIVFRFPVTLQQALEPLFTAPEHFLERFGLLPGPADRPKL